ncbi:MAG: YncE family protein [Alphaproteobacteria bacterium]|nr:YncE family protein [Alphaproteobacteria bacterium]
MRRLAALAGLLLCSTAAHAGLMISANDGKQIVKGDPTPRTPDSVSVLDMNHYPPRVIGTLQVPAAMIGSPNAVAVGAGEKFAIITAAQNYVETDPENPVPGDTVSVVDLADPAHPRLLQTVHAGLTPGGVSINRAGNLVLVAGKTDDSVTVFTLLDKHLTPAGKVDLGKGAAPSDVVFAPDGRKAYAVAMGATRIMELEIDGSRVTRSGKDVATGNSPYGAMITPDGNWLINTNVGGMLEKKTAGTLTMIDLKTGKLALNLEVGKTPEHVALSPDGRYAALVLANGAATVRSDPKYDGLVGIVRIYALGPGTLTPVTEASSCHWAQGLAWSDDGKLVLQQCATERIIQVFRFDGHSLARDDAASLTFESRPGSLSTQHSR